MYPKTDTQMYKLNHAMIRVKDPRNSIRFYELLGLAVIQKLSFPESKFDLYFLGIDTPTAPSHGKLTFDRQGLVELTHNYGTENDDNYRVSTGNDKSHLGFSHISITMDNVRAASQVLLDAGHKFYQEASISSGRTVIALDPDGYHIQLVSRDEVAQPVGLTSCGTHSVNHYALRVRDMRASVRYYTETLGLNLIKTVENDAEFVTVCYLGYPSDGRFTENEKLSRREGLLALIARNEVDNDATVHYHNGNDHPQGFGHICITVDNIGAACERLESLNVSWKKRLTDGKMKNVAFLLDPDNYWIELVQNEGFTGKANF